MKIFAIAAVVTVMFSTVTHAEDMKAVLEREAGTVARQLLEYNRQADVNEAAVPTNAVRAFKFWVNATLAAPFAIPETNSLSFHYRTTNSCDAIRTTYEKDGLHITVLQTKVTMMIIVEGEDTVFAKAKNANTHATRIAQRVLGWSDEASLVSNGADGGIFVGQGKERSADKSDHGAVPSSGRRKGGFILDRWWADGKVVGFFGVKEPFGNEALVVVVPNMKSLPRNQQ